MLTLPDELHLCLSKPIAHNALPCTTPSIPKHHPDPVTQEEISDLVRLARSSGLKSPCKDFDWADGHADGRHEMPRRGLQDGTRSIVHQAWKGVLRSEGIAQAQCSKSLSGLKAIGSKKKSHLTCRHTHCRSIGCLELD